MASAQSFNTSRGEFEGQIRSDSYGPGSGVTCFTLMGTVTMISTTTPLTDDEVEVRFTTYHEEGDDVAAKIGVGFGAEVIRQFGQDIPGHVRISLEMPLTPKAHARPPRRHRCPPSFNEALEAPLGCARVQWR